VDLLDSHVFDRFVPSTASLGAESAFGIDNNWNAFKLLVGSLTISSLIVTVKFQLACAIMMWWLSL